MSPFAMETLQIYSHKAEKYARFRWDYAPAAVGWVCETSGANAATAAADLGAGTGKLTRPLAERVGTVYAVEPNAEMRHFLEAALSEYPNCRVLDGRAEQTGLEAHSVDLVTAAQAIHWFDLQAARTEMRRILRPGGWMAVLRNRNSDGDLSAALEPVLGAARAMGAQVLQATPPHLDLIDFYFAGADHEKRAFEFTLQETWEPFWGSLCSAAFMPEEDHLQFPMLEQAARRVFEKFSVGGILAVCGVTDVWLGKLP